MFSNLKVMEEEIQGLKESALTAVSQSTKAALDIQSLMNQASDPEKVPKFKSKPIHTLMSISCPELIDTGDSLFYRFWSRKNNWWHFPRRKCSRLPK